MNPHPRFVAGVLALALATSAAAEPREVARAHATIQYAALTVDADPLAADANPGAVILRIGHRVTEHLGIQGRFGIRADRDHVRGELPGRPAGRVEVRLDRLAGLYVTARAPLGARFEGHAVAGYSDARASIADADAAVTASRAGPSWGIGVDYRLDTDYRLGIEYMQYLSAGDLKLSAIGIGVSVRL